MIIGRNGRRNYVTRDPKLDFKLKLATKRTFKRAFLAKFREVLRSLNR